jgi:hypothetical protein
MMPAALSVVKLTPGKRFKMDDVEGLSLSWKEKEEEEEAFKDEFNDGCRRRASD